MGKQTTCATCTHGTALADAMHVLVHAFHAESQNDWQKKQKKLDCVYVYTA